MLGIKLSDYHVTESGFGADIGFEKFWNLKCRMSGLQPCCAVIVATVRALKSHGGGPPVPPGKPLDHVYVEENVGMVEKGCANLIHHIETVKKAGVNPVVCINPFSTDTRSEIAEIKRQAEAAGARVAVSYHYSMGGEGALELTDAVIDACEEKSKFKFLYDLSTPLSRRIELIAKEVYGADGVQYFPDAEEKLKKIDKDPELSKLGTCMVKTHLRCPTTRISRGCQPAGFCRYEIS